MDALSDVLRAAHLNGGVFLQAEFTAPWCMAARVTPQFCAPFLRANTAHLILYHYVVEGELHASGRGRTATAAAERRTSCSFRETTAIC